MYELGGRTLDEAAHNIAEAIALWTAVTEDESKPR